MKKKPIDVVAAILHANQKVLVGKRMATDTNAGKWEFPGGKIKPGESPENALKREIMEELGIEIENLSLFQEVQHDYSRYSVHILFYFVEIDQEIQVEQKSHDELRWINMMECSDLDFLEANWPVLEKLRTKS